MRPSPLRSQLPVSEYLGGLTSDAGPDQCLTEARAGAGASLTLDGSLSSSASDHIVRYLWTLEGEACPFGDSKVLQQHWPAGSYAVRLEVTDSTGHTQTDSTIIQVAAIAPR